MSDLHSAERERFEAWAVSILGDNPTWRGSGDCELAWQAWQAALSAPAVPPSVIAVAREFVNNEYRGPLHQARLVFDCIAALDAAPSAKEPQT